MLGSDPGSVFSVAPITGQISLNSRLDYEVSESKVMQGGVKQYTAMRSNDMSCNSMQLK